MSTTDPYIAVRIAHLVDRIKRLTHALDKLQEQYDFAPSFLVRKNLEGQIEQIRESISQYRTEFSSLTASQAARQAEDVSEQQKSVAELEERIVRVETDLKEVKTFIEQYPQQHQAWVERVYQTIDRQYLHEVNTLLNNTEKLTEQDKHAVIGAVQKANITSRQTATRRAELVQTGQELLREAGLTFNTKFKLCVPLIPLLLNWDTELGFDGTIDLLALWQRLVDFVTGL